MQYLIAVVFTKEGLDQKKNTRELKLVYKVSNGLFTS